MTRAAIQTGTAASMAVISTPGSTLGLARRPVARGKIADLAREGT
jgi:hypothetical protein